jgi:hypothetical protein
MVRSLIGKVEREVGKGTLGCWKEGTPLARVAENGGNCEKGEQLFALGKEKGERESEEENEIRI